MRLKLLSTFLVFGLAACGGDTEPAPDAAPAPATDAPAAASPGQLTSPDWYQVDHDAGTVNIDLVAGATSANNYWNFHGFSGGTGGITVPEGYTVTINLINQDPAMGHSVGVGELMASYPNNFQNPQPVFAGALTENPTSMTESTMPGETESITFVADASGEYALVCFVIGHASAGMWMPFTVSADGDAGVTR